MSRDSRLGITVTATVRDAGMLSLDIACIVAFRCSGNPVLNLPERAPNLDTLLIQYCTPVVSLGRLKLKLKLEWRCYFERVDYTGVNRDKTGICLRFKGRFILHVFGR